MMNLKIIFVLKLDNIHNIKDHAFAKTLLEIYAKKKHLKLLINKNGKKNIYLGIPAKNYSILIYFIKKV